MSNPHDATFKAVLGDPEHARGALQAVVPAALAEAIDWTQLARCPGSFVDPHLRELHTDLLFSAAFRGGGEALFYFLFEHQSSPDGPLMAFRLLRYQVRIWENWRAKHMDAAVLPIG
ncbi:MAG TPA: Rpn family recombination-promoting nuclease/putative transposase [Kofleriaceae bacterium]|nr:Rpn family recombination-promoting nuclease/putative transposase [Kofleriaceae bacterium]